MAAVARKPRAPPPDPPGDFEYLRPHLYKAQQEAIFDAKDAAGNLARYALIEASTKAGKTAGCMAWLIEQAMINGGENRNFWWIAPVYGQAKIAWRRIKFGLTKGTFTANEQDLWIKLPNGAVIWFKSGEKPDNLYGEDVYAAVIDEASRVREDSWYALRSTITATNGPVRFIGNVKGRKNWFFSMCRKAQAGEPGYAYRKLTAYDAVDGGILDLAEVESAKRDLPPNVFNELYLAIPSDDGGNPFGLSNIAKCVVPDLSPEKTIAAGIDLAKSHDWTVVIGLDEANGAVTGFERWQSPWRLTIRRITELVEGIPTLVDSTGVGDPVLEELQALRDDHEMEGYVFSSASKQRLMEGLAVAIQSEDVHFPDGPIKAELDNFEFEYTRTGVRYSAPEGYHDDCVMALALAVEMRRRVAPMAGSQSPYGSEREPAPWSGGSGEE